jgi:hypothetical protein
MSNSDPSAIVLHGIRCIGGLYIGSIRMEKSVRAGFAAIQPFQIAGEASNWLGIPIENHDGRNFTAAIGFVFTLTFFTREEDCRLAVPANH